MNDFHLYSLTRPGLTDLANHGIGVGNALAIDLDDDISANPDDIVANLRARGCPLETGSGGRAAGCHFNDHRSCPDG